MNSDLVDPLEYSASWGGAKRVPLNPIKSADYSARVMHAMYVFWRNQQPRIGTLTTKPGILEYMLDLEEQQRLAVKAKKSSQVLLIRAEREREAELEESNFLAVDIANCTHDQDATLPLLFSLWHQLDVQTIYLPLFTIFRVSLDQETEYIVHWNFF